MAEGPRVACPNASISAMIFRGAKKGMGRIIDLLAAVCRMRQARRDPVARPFFRQV